MTSPVDRLVDKADPGSNRGNGTDVIPTGLQGGVQRQYYNHDFDLDEIKDDAERILSEHTYLPAPEEKVEFEVNCSSYWDNFYHQHSKHFFKDRHYLDKEFPELLPSESDGKTFFEVGCGAGNSFLPLVRTMSKSYVYGADCSQKAIELVKSNESYEPNRCLAFVYDVTSADLPQEVPEQSVDYLLLIFALSAMPPSHFAQVVLNLWKLLRPGGSILFRDYARMDLAQLRMPRDHRLGKNYYHRGDGTLAYYFEKDEICSLFETGGFVTDECEYCTIKNVNRKKRLTMHRVWLHGKWRKPLE